MTDKEKVIAYDNVVNKLKKFIQQGVEPLITKNDVQDFFPELAESESEDEKIRKEMIAFLQETIDTVGDSPNIWTLCNAKKWLAWLKKQSQEPKKVSIWKHWKDGIAGNGEGEPIYLVKNGNTYSLNSCLGWECDYIELSELDNLMLEKQGEQKSTDNLTQQEAMDIVVAKCFNEQKAVDKVEPKFKVDDWITNGHCTRQITFIDSRYWYSETCVLGDITSIDKTFHLWSINDAKDGDILAEDSCIFIIQKLGDNNTVAKTYFTLYNDGDFDDGTILYFDIDSTKPATKEQRDLLEKTMAKAGYKWNSEEKRIMKVPKLKEPEGALKQLLNDENEVQNTFIISHYTTWSEEDEGNLIDTCVAIRKFYHGTNGAQELINWLKSLKQRVVWKPTKEQLRALRWVLNNIPYNTHKEEISGLLDQIKDL